MCVLGGRGEKGFNIPDCPTAKPCRGVVPRGNEDNNLVTDYVSIGHMHGMCPKTLLRHNELVRYG